MRGVCRVCHPLRVDTTVPVSLCICTYKRPDLLAAALESIAASPRQPAEVLVSDDSPDDITKALIESRFPTVRWVRGPRAGGIGGNRNATAKLATQLYLAFIDDDAAVPASFFDEIDAIIRETPESVVTGTVRNHFPDGSSNFEIPSGANFLGFPTKPWDAGNSNMLTMSATVFPASLFEKTSFDSKLIYGFEELDIARRAAALEYPVLLRESFVVDHFPQHAFEKRLHVSTSRIYSTWNFYRNIQRRPVRAALFMAVAVPQHLQNGARRRHGIDGIGEAWSDIRAAIALF